MSTTSTKTPDAYQEYKKHSSSRSGTTAAWLMKITSIALIPLSLWFLINLLGLSQEAYIDARVWLQRPIAGIIALLFAVVSIYHGMLGVKVVIEDYVHSKKSRLIGTLLLKFVSYIMLVVAMVSIIKIILG